VINISLHLSGWKGIVKIVSATHILQAVIQMNEKFAVVVNKSNGEIEHVGIVEGMSGLIQLLETTESTAEEVAKYEIYKRNA
jgi:hypothetical protein